MGFNSGFKGLNTFSTSSGIQFVTNEKGQLRLEEGDSIFGNDADLSLHRHVEI